MQPSPRELSLEQQMQAIIDETLNNSKNQDSDLQHLRVDDNVLRLFLKFEHGEVVEGSENANYWPLLASIVIKATKSQSLKKLIEKVESFKMQFKVEEDLSTNVAGGQRANFKKAWKGMRMPSIMPLSSLAARQG